MRSATSMKWMWLPLLILLLFFQAARSHAQSSPRKLPDVPTNVVAVPLREAALVAWIVPAPAPEDAPSPTSYTVTAYDFVVHRVASVTKATAPGVVIEGLRGNHCYHFTVHATNTAGDSPESDASELACPTPPPGADLEVSMAATETFSDNQLSFTITVVNNGLDDVPMVNLTDTLPAPLASYTASQGICSGEVGATTFRCNLGALHQGESATISVSISVTNAEVTNTASVAGFDTNGKSVSDPLPDNNTATLTTHTGSYPSD